MTKTDSYRGVKHTIELADLDPGMICSSPKNGKSMLLLAMAFMMAAVAEPYRREIKEKPALSDAEKQAKRRELNLRKGLKEFYMGDGTTVWALNEENAIRKFKNKSYGKRNIRRQ